MMWWGTSWGASICKDTNKIDPPPPETLCTVCVRNLIKCLGIAIPMLLNENILYYYHAWCFLEDILGEKFAYTVIPEGPNPEDFEQLILVDDL